MEQGIVSPREGQQFDVCLAKASRYCSDRDRCEKEIRRKLNEWHCPVLIHDQIIGRLKLEGFLDELRYAKNYCRGKFRMNGWGRVKIMASLLQNGISKSMIHEAFGEIDDDGYQASLKDILEKKWKVTGGQGIVRRNKTAVHAISKGYEASLVYVMLNQIIRQ